MNRRIVVIDDEVDLLHLIGDLLEMERISVLALSDPALARCIAAGDQVDLFLIDVMMPTISGIEVAQDLRQERFPRTPMVAMSASRLMCRVASQSGMFQDVLEKPFDMVELLGCIDSCLAADSRRSVPDRSAR